MPDVAHHPDQERRHLLLAHRAIDPTRCRSQGAAQGTFGRPGVLSEADDVLSVKPIDLRLPADLRRLLAGRGIDRCRASVHDGNRGPRHEASDRRIVDLVEPSQRQASAVQVDPRILARAFGVDREGVIPITNR